MPLTWKESADRLAEHSVMVITLPFAFFFLFRHLSICFLDNYSVPCLVSSIRVVYCVSKPHTNTVCLLKSLMQSAQICLSSSVLSTKAEHDNLVDSWTTKHTSYSSRDCEIQVHGDGRFSAGWGPGAALTRNVPWGLLKALIPLIKVAPLCPDRFPHTHFKCQTPHRNSFSTFKRVLLFGAWGWEAAEECKAQSTSVTSHIMPSYVFFLKNLCFLLHHVGFWE